MRLGQLRARGDREQDIDIAPLIDVVFILLIFFMVSTTFVRDTQLDIERPSAKSVTSADVRAIRVSLSRSGQVTLDGQSINPWTLEERVRAITAVHPERTVLITADTDAPTGKLVELVDQCRLGGAKNVGVDVKVRP